jgi:hypothetical protein
VLHINLDYVFRGSVYMKLFLYFSLLLGFIMEMSFETHTCPEFGMLLFSSVNHVTHFHESLVQDMLRDIKCIA